MRIGGLIGLMAAILLPLFLFEFLKYGSHHMDVSLVYHKGHFYIVSAVSVLATILGFAVGVAGSRLRNIKVSFLALAFISLAGIFSIHGLATPGFIMNAFTLPGFMAQMSVLVASFWICLSCLSSDNALISYMSRAQKYLVPAWTLILVILSTLIVMFPHAAETLIPSPTALNKGIITVIVVLMNLTTIYSYFRSYRYSKFPLQLAIVYSAGWFLVTQVILAMGELWKLSWWLYHLLLLAAVAVMIGGMLRQYAAHASVTKAFHALFTTDPVERMTNSLSPSVKALIHETESRDPYTAGHNFRVTLYSLRIGEEMGLQPELLHALVQGTIVHDVGKIRISDAVLNKPGRLTAEERAVIETHPLKGYEMCNKLGFLKEELSIIRSHHERWDGKGYPDSLSGTKIPLLARVAAVADVYDALTSHRAYREAWSHDKAMELLNENKGTHFDPVMVEAWERVCEKDPAVYQSASQIA
jgi:HD-GYP domain-containing protein (c-di-GMP phosphodiesterase class II)